MKLSSLLFTSLASLAAACAGGGAQEPPASAEMAPADAPAPMESAAAPMASAPAPMASAAAPMQDAPASTSNIVQTAVAAGSFTTLVAAVKAAGLAETLSGPGPFTVFAPTDDAFKKLPAGTVESLLKPENKAKLVKILTYHVVPGMLMAKDVVGAKSLKTVEGQDLTVKVMGSMVHINGAMISKTDIVASNGVIHVIDSVILPK